MKSNCTVNGTRIPLAVRPIRKMHARIRFHSLRKMKKTMQIVHSIHKQKKIQIPAREECNLRISIDKINKDSHSLLMHERINASRGNVSK